MNEGVKLMNKITVVGGNFCDNLLRATTHFPRRQHNDGSDIVVAYGIGNTRIPGDILVLNRHLVTNKYEQQKLLGDDIGLSVATRRDYFPEFAQHNLIIKPYHSIGGKGIRDANGSEASPHREYYQKKFPKNRSKT